MLIGFLNAGVLIVAPLILSHNNNNYIIISSNNNVRFIYHQENNNNTVEYTRLRTDSFFNLTAHHFISDYRLFLYYDNYSVVDALSTTPPPPAVNRFRFC